MGWKRQEMGRVRQQGRTSLATGGALQITLRLLAPAAGGGLRPNRPGNGWCLVREVLKWTNEGPGDKSVRPVQQLPGRYAAWPVRFN